MLHEQMKNEFQCTEVQDMICSLLFFLKGINFTCFVYMQTLGGCTSCWFTSRKVTERPGQRWEEGLVFTLFLLKLLEPFALCMPSMHKINELFTNCKF